MDAATARYRSQPTARRLWPVGAAALSVLTGACGAGGASAASAGRSPTTLQTLPGLQSSAGATTPSGAGQAAGPSNLSPFPASAASSCTTPQLHPNGQGNPHVPNVPPIRSVAVAPRSGGLAVQYRFGGHLQAPPEGVYFAWTITLYRHRADANKPTSAIELQVEDRGAGWEPTGWALSASTYTDNTPLVGNVTLTAGGTLLTTFFPAGFANLKPPFFWYASQEAYRAYLPRGTSAHHQDFSVNGAITIDCPSGVRQSPYSLPLAAKLLAAG